MEMGSNKISACSHSHFFLHGIKLCYEIPDIAHSALKLYLVGVPIVKAIKCDGFPNHPIFHWKPCLILSETAWLFWPARY